MQYTAAVITVSDKGSRGERVDTSGPAVCRLLEDAGFKVVHTAIVPDEKLRTALKEAIHRAHADMPNLFGAIAQTAAYTHGDAWMDAVVAYISENMDYACGFLADKLPEIQCRRPEGTYLLWLDMRGLGMTHEQTMDLLINRAHIAINSGLFFGEEGRGWFRMNLATRRANVEATVENLYQAIRSK